MPTSLNTDVINPFLASLLNVLTTMAQTEARPGKPRLKTDATPLGPVSAIMDMNGPQLHGSFAVTFTKPVICAVAQNMLGESVEEVNDDIANLTGEITNMVAGGAKNLLSEKGFDFDLAQPKVLTGNDYKLEHPCTSSTIVIPFSADSGDFYVEVAMEKVN